MKFTIPAETTVEVSTSLFRGWRQHITRRTLEFDGFKSHAGHFYIFQHDDWWIPGRWRTRVKLECSGAVSVAARPRNSRRLKLSEQRQAIPRWLAMPSK